MPTSLLRRSGSKQTINLRTIQLPRHPRISTRTNQRHPIRPKLHKRPRNSRNTHDVGRVDFSTQDTLFAVGAWGDEVFLFRAVAAVAEADGEGDVCELEGKRH